MAQILAQHGDLLPYFHGKASTSSDAILTSTATAKEMMQTALGSYEKTYVIIDGLDECGRDDRSDIARWFQAVTEEALGTTDLKSIRCLFVSQDDGIARDDFRSIRAIKITNENAEDLRNFAGVWHERIERRFGDLGSRNYHISNIISARAQGKPTENLTIPDCSDLSRHVHLRRAVREVSRRSTTPSSSS